MSERPQPFQLKIWEEDSKTFERFARMRARPGEYSPEDIKDTFAAYAEAITKYGLAIQFDSEGWVDHYERIIMGIFHHPQIQEPPELKYKLNRN